MQSGGFLVLSSAQSAAIEFVFLCDGDAVVREKENDESNFGG